MSVTRRTAEAYRDELVKQCKLYLTQLQEVYEQDYDVAISLCLSMRELFTIVNRLQSPIDDKILEQIKSAYSALLSHIEIKEEKVSAQSFLQFIEQVEAHLHEEFSWKVGDWPPPLLREYVLYALLRARNFLVFSQSNVAAYIHLAINFGRNFHCDERYPWAQEYLKQSGDETTRVDEMLWRAMGERGAKELREKFPFTENVPLKERDEQVHLQRAE